MWEGLRFRSRCDCGPEFPCSCGMPSLYWRKRRDERKAKFSPKEGMNAKPNSLRKKGWTQSKILYKRRDDRKAKFSTEEGMNAKTNFLHSWLKKWTWGWRIITGSDWFVVDILCRSNGLCETSFWPICTLSILVVTIFSKGSCSRHWKCWGADVEILICCCDLQCANFPFCHIFSVGKKTAHRWRWSYRPN